MTVTTDDETPREATGPAFSDAITFAFGDPAADVYAVARVGRSPGEDGNAQGSGLAVVFSGRDPVSVRAGGGLPVSGDGWDAVDAAGVRTTVEEPLRAWTVSFESEDATTGFELRFEAVSEPAALATDSPVAVLGGMTGYEQLCRVTGTARVRGGRRRVDCLGQRGHSWGAPDWERVVLARTVSAWIDDAHGVSLTALRPTGKKLSHADEAVAANVFVPGGDEQATAGGLAAAVAVQDARLSTTMDGEERQRRAGLELWVDPEGYPLRASGEVLCGTSLDLGRLRLDCSFFAWTMDGRHGVGRYDVLRRVA